MDPMIFIPIAFLVATLVCGKFFWEALSKYSDEEHESFAPVVWFVWGVVCFVLFCIFTYFYINL